MDIPWIKSPENFHQAKKTPKNCRKKNAKKHTGRFLPMGPVVLSPSRPQESCGSAVKVIASSSVVVAWSIGRARCYEALELRVFQATVSPKWGRKVMTLGEDVLFFNIIVYIIFHYVLIFMSSFFFVMSMLVMFICVIYNYLQLKQHVMTSWRGQFFNIFLFSRNASELRIVHRARIGHGDYTVWRLRLMKGLPAVMAGSNLLFRPIPRWWFQTCFILNLTWGNYPFWRAYFSTGLLQPSVLCTVNICQDVFGLTS